MSDKTKNLLIVESPSKIKKIQEILDKYPKISFIVMASKGHIRDLDSKKLSINIEQNFEPEYSVSESKKFVVQELKSRMKQCDFVWLASDLDREGESISWHISEVLGLKPEKRKRIAFTEITKKAIVDAIENPRDINMDMFYAQQARRVLDRLIGYLLSPLLWSHIQNSYKKKISLSAGRVQSVVLKLVLERETEIKAFESNSYFKINGLMSTQKKSELKVDLDDNIEDAKDCLGLIKYCKSCKFIVSDVKVNKTTRKPSPPFTTSTLQQEASIKLNMSPKTTMLAAQKLYENGHITYMRTDSVALSEDAMNMIETTIKNNYGDEYFKKVEYKSKSKNSQEAHEACRPCKFEVKDLDDSDMESSQKRLYKLIWKRTVSSQMSPTKMEIYTIKIDIGESDYKFISKQERVLFDGFQKLYKITKEEDTDDEDSMVNKIQKVKKGDELNYIEIKATEKYSRPTNSRFTEASLVKKLDDMEIGRPSTYSSMVSLIQERNYVEKKDILGKEVDTKIFKLSEDNIETIKDKCKIGGDKQKLVPTDVGEIVVNFLDKHFNNIMDYKFTALVEQHLDDISNGKKDWVTVVKGFYDKFYNKIDEVKSLTLEKDKFKRKLGLDPSTKMEIFTYIGKYGPLVQLKNLDGDDKFAPLNDISIGDVKLEEAIELLKYPLNLGSHKKDNIMIHVGKFGKYIKYSGKNYSIKDIEEITVEKAIEIIEGTVDTNLIKRINKDIVIRNGKYGAYINYKNKTNVKIYGKIKPEDLTLDDCRELINKKIKKK